MAVKAAVLLLTFAALAAGQARDKHDFMLVLDSTSGMMPAINTLYSTFDYLQSQNHLLRRTIRSFALLTLNTSPGETVLTRNRSPRRLARSLPFRLSPGSAICRVPVFQAIKEAVSATEGCPDIVVVTKSLPSDSHLLNEVHRAVNERNGKVSVITVHSCEGDQSSYDELAVRTGGTRAHLQPAQRRQMERLVADHLLKTDSAVLVSTMKPSVGGQIDIPFSVGAGMETVDVTVRCPETPGRPSVTVSSGSSSQASPSATGQAGDLYTLTYSNLATQEWSMSVSDVQGQCQVRLSSSPGRHYGTGWHQLPTPGSTGFSNYLLLSATESQHITDVVSVILTGSTGQEIVSLQRSQAFQLASNSLIFGPIARPDDGSQVHVVWSSSQVPVRHLANRCKLDVSAEALDSFQGGDTSEGGQGVELPRLPEPSVVLETEAPITTAVPTASIPRTCRQENLPNGYVLLGSGTPIRAGAVAYYICNPGYRLRSTSTPQKRCSASGKWEPATEQECISSSSPPVIHDRQLRSSGSCVYLPCSASGSPAPVLNWKFMGRMMQRHQLAPNMRIHNNGTLSICSGHHSNSGNYTCRVWNQAGTAEKTYPVFFGSAPVIERMDLPTRRGSCVLLPCRASGNPTPGVSWRKDDQPLQTQTSDYSRNGTGLVVCNGRPALGGVYKCVAQNGGGSDSRQFELAFNAPDTDPPTTSPVTEPEGAAVARYKALLETANNQNAALQSLIQSMQQQLQLCQGTRG